VTALARPAVVAALLSTAAALLHPAVRSDAWLPERNAAFAAALLLVAVALVARALVASGPRRLGPGLLAGGAVVAIAAVGTDGVLGHRGSFDLVLGQGRTHFDEVGPGGEPLGLRPFGFTLGLEETLAGGGVALALPGRSEGAVLAPGRAVGHGGFRFGSPRFVKTGAAARLRVAVSGEGDDLIVDLVPGRPARAGELSLSLEEYYPDFALDDQQRPFTRSLEPRNPGAVLGVETPRGTFRAFVLRAMPGVHRVEEIGRSFALLAVDPETRVEIDVHREPLAGMALFGALLALAGVILEGRTP
jgi:hypothetical protein